MHAENKSMNAQETKMYKLMNCNSALKLVAEAQSADLSLKLPMRGYCLAGADNLAEGQGTITAKAAALIC